MKNAFWAAAHAILGTDAQGNQIPYEIDEENKATITDLCHYFNGHSDYSGNLLNGIILQGNVGSGKSMLMRIFQLLSTRPFNYKPCRDVAEEFANGGSNALRIYGKGSMELKNQQPKLTIFEFDDLGREVNKKFYGNESNVMAEIIQTRYELYKDGLITHYTTNLTKKEIEEKYGDTILSRLEETCNWHKLGVGAQSKDRRVPKKG